MEREMDLARVHKKIAEAQFFLFLMCKEEHRSTGNRDAFDYYLSAFLSAGRPVDYRLRHEQKSIYKPWRKEWERG